MKKTLGFYIIFDKNKYKFVQILNRVQEEINNMRWRYATKKFDSDYQMDKALLDQLLSLTTLAPSSYGLQPYEILVIGDKALREKLKKVSYNQAQITESSYLVVFAVYNNLSQNRLDSLTKQMKKERNLEDEKINNFNNHIAQTTKKMPKRDFIQWANNQAYLALGFFLYACCRLKIDACPMEGFEKESYNKILGFADKQLETSVIACIGKRSQEDTYQHEKKVRRTKEELYTFV